MAMLRFLPKSSGDSLLEPGLLIVSLEPSDADLDQALESDLDRRAGLHDMRPLRRPNRQIPRRRAQDSSRSSLGERKRHFAPAVGREDAHAVVELRSNSGPRLTR